MGASPLAQAWWQADPLGIHRDQSARLTRLAEQKQITLPHSSATGWIRDGTSLELSSTEIGVNGTRVLELNRDEADQVQVPESELDPDLALFINGENSLYQALYDERTRLVVHHREEDSKRVAWKLLHTVTESNVLRRGLGFSGQINVLIDRQVPFDVIHRTMYTAGQAQYTEFGFIVDNPVLGERVSIHSSAPPIGPPRPLDEYEPFKLIVSLQQGGLHLDGSSHVRAVAGANEFFLPCTSEGTALERCEGTESYDWPGLAERLVQIKKSAGGDEEWFTLVPDHSVAFETMVRAMDVARDGAGLVELDPTWKKLPEPGQTNYREDRAPLVLFPTVTIGGGVLED
jgi:hypothetical protein